MEMGTNLIITSDLIANETKKGKDALKSCKCIGDKHEIIQVSHNLCV